MKIQERSFRGQFKRPKTHIYFNEEINLGIVTTIWGDAQLFDRIKNEIQDYFSAAISDVDVTTPFGYIESQTSLSNYLRISLLLLNDSLYRSENRSEYNFGCEILVFAIRNQELSFASIGQPQMYLRKKDRIYFLNSSLGLNEELGTAYCYLPKELLGVVKTCYPAVGSVKIDKVDEICFLSGLTLNDKNFLLNNQFNIQTSIEHINSLQNKDHLHSFWFASLNF